MSRDSDDPDRDDLPQTDDLSQTGAPAGASALTPVDAPEPSAAGAGAVKEPASVEPASVEPPVEPASVESPLVEPPVESPHVESPPVEPPGEEAIVESEHEVRVRRTPRYGRFMILGGVLFAVASFILTYSFPQGSGYDRNTVFGFVLLASVAVGVGLGALAAIIAAAATRRTERTVLADRIGVRRAATGDRDLTDLGEIAARDGGASDQRGASTGRDAEQG